MIDGYLGNLRKPCLRFMYSLKEINCLKSDWARKVALRYLEGRRLKDISEFEYNLPFRDRYDPELPDCLSCSCESLVYEFPNESRMHLSRILGSYRDNGLDRSNDIYWMLDVLVVHSLNDKQISHNKLKDLLGRYGFNFGCFFRGFFERKPSKYNEHSPYSLFRKPDQNRRYAPVKRYNEADYVD